MEPSTTSPLCSLSNIAIKQRDSILALHITYHNLDNDNDNTHHNNKVKMPASLEESHRLSFDEDSSQDRITTPASSRDRIHSPTPSSDHNMTDAFDCSSTGLMSPKAPSTSIEFDEELTAKGSLVIDDLSIDPPGGLEEICTMLRSERHDTRVTEEDQSIHRVLLADAAESNEAFLVQSLLLGILGHPRIQTDPQVRLLPVTKWTSQEVLSNILGQPEPDFTLGLRCKTRAIQFGYTFDLARDYHKQLVPGKNIISPLLTVEAKGPAGNLNQTRIQNRHNAACMLRNIVALKRAAGLPERSYQNQILVLTIEATTAELQVSCHWTDGEDHYLSAVIQEPTRMADLSMTRQLARNAIDWAKQEFDKVENELFKSIEAKPPKTRKRKRGGKDCDKGTG